MTFDGAMLIASLLLVIVCCYMLWTMFVGLVHFLFFEKKELQIKYLKQQLGDKNGKL